MSTTNSSTSNPDPQIDWPIQHEVGEEEKEEKSHLIDGPMNGSLHPNDGEEQIGAKDDDDVDDDGDQRAPTPWSIPWILMDTLVTPSTNTNVQNDVDGDSSASSQSSPVKLIIPDDDDDVEGVEKVNAEQLVKVAAEDAENAVEMKTASSSTTTTTPEMDGAPLWEEQEEEEKEKQTVITIPLLDYLCAYMECSLKELQILLQSLEPRRRLLNHLQTCHLRTSHLRPAERNMTLHAHDLSSQNANLAYACGGYLDITVRQWYYIRHGRKLKHPYLPCLIEFGGGLHASYYPLEVVSVHLTKTTTTTTITSTGASATQSCSNNNSNLMLTTPINHYNHNTNKHHIMCGCHHCCCMAHKYRK